MVEEPLPVFLSQMHLHGGCQPEEIVQRAALHRVPHRDVDIADVRRYGVQDRDQKTLVRKDHGAVLVLQQGRKKFRLSHSRRHTDNLNSGYGLRVVVQGESLSEFVHVPGHKKRGVVAGVFDHL